MTIHRLSGPVGLRDPNNRTDVAKIETLLALAGVLDIDKTDGPTGFVGQRMDQGIKVFQKDRGLQADGRLDPQGPTHKALAQNLQDMGRGGDTILAHITPVEAQLLHNITDGGTINPVTGLPEFFFGELFGGLGDSFASGLSSIGDSFSSGLSDFTDSFSKGFDNFSSGLGDIGDGISDGFSDLFGVGDSAGQTGKGLDSGLNSGLARPNLLETRDGPVGSNSMMDTFRKNAGLPARDNAKPAVNILEGSRPNTPVGRTPRVTPTPFNSAVNKVDKRSGPTGIAPPTSGGMSARQKHNIATFHNQQTARLKQQSLLSNPVASKLAPPTLSDAALSSNRRLADSLAKTGDFSAIKRHITPGLEKADPKAIAETNNLIEQMNKVSPGHGDKLAKELPGLRGRSGNDDLNDFKPLYGGTEDDTLGMATQPKPVHDFDGLGEQDLRKPEKPAGLQEPHELSEHKKAANDRLAKQLVDQDNYSQFARQTKSGYKNPDLKNRLKAKAESRDLLKRMNERDPAKADKLARELGFKSLNDALEKPRALKGTTFFGGVGMNGAYIDDMKKSLEEAGIKNVRVADPNKWSSGTLGDAASVPLENNIDGEDSDFSGFDEEGEQFNMVGYSYGGLQAAQGAIDHADKGGKVDNLILVGTPIEQEFLNSLENHPNIGKVTVIDLGQHGDPIKAGMSDAEVLGSVPRLSKDVGKDYFRKASPKSGHFYYSGDDPESQRRR